MSETTRPETYRLTAGVIRLVLETLPPECPVRYCRLGEYPKAVEPSETVAECLASMSGLVKQHAMTVDDEIVVAVQVGDGYFTLLTDPMLG